MDEEKIKVVLLGLDSSLLSKVTERINSSRPVEAHYFTELKDFLEYNIANSPHIVGISVSFPHKNISNFPKILRMSLNVPVVAFGENQQTKTRKNLSSCQADFKITGVITAHNLWMKLLNFKKQQEAEASGGAEGKKSGGQSQKNSFHLKGGSEDKKQGDQGSILSSLFAAMDGKDPEDNKSNLNMLASKNEEDSSSSSQGSIVNGDAGTARSNASNYNSTSQGSMAGGGDENASYLGSLDGNSSGGDAGSGNDSESTTNPSAAAQGDLKGADGQGPNAEMGPSKASDQEGPDSSTSSNTGNGPKAKSPETQPSKTAEDNKDESAGEAATLATEGQDGEKAKKDKEKDFGKVQLADEAEVKKEAKEKNDKKRKEEDAKKRNALEEASKVALENVFFAKTFENPRIFESDKISLFAIEIGEFKGFIFLANSFQHEESIEVLSEFRTEILEQLKERNFHGEMSKAFEISIELENYADVVGQFSNFLILHEDEAGKQICVSFMQRESISPRFMDSDKEDMFLIDIQTIPPKTKVNFDAFLFLPRNKRFVRYLKEGRSLSLKQAQRHSEDKEKSRLYLPKDHKAKFVQFYIQNTINWEVAVAAGDPSSDEAA